MESGEQWKKGAQDFGSRAYSGGELDVAGEGKRNQSEGKRNS